MVSFDDFVGMHQILNTWLANPDNKSLNLTREQVIVVFDILNESQDYESYQERLEGGDYPLLTGEGD